MNVAAVTATMKEATAVNGEGIPAADVRITAMISPYLPQATSHTAYTIASPDDTPSDA